MKRGFSLIEMMVSLSISLLLLITLYGVLSSELKSWHKLADKTADNQIGLAVLNTMVNDIRSASQLLPGPSPDQLNLTVNNESVQYSLRDRKVRRQVRGYASYLTDVGEVTKLKFNCLSPKLVEIQVNKFAACAALRN